MSTDLQTKNAIEWLRREDARVLKANLRRMTTQRKKIAAAMVTMSDLLLGLDECIANVKANLEAANASL